jgi:uncharacterized protein (DUF305 family)
MPTHAEDLEDLGESADLVPPIDDDNDNALADPAPRGLIRTLTAIIVVAVLAMAVALGHVWGADSKHVVATPSASSVDAGFASDMSTHHQQAITMATYAYDNSTNPSIKLIAFDIQSAQTSQLGEMQGWLDTWGLVRNSNDKMAWMAGHAHLEPDGLMPGMATPTQLDQLEASHGKALNLLFLQLMIHHHQGGVQMAQYAAEHATEPYVRNLAQAMFVVQSNEIIEMEQLLRQLGGTPLPPPAN